MPIVSALGCKGVLGVLSGRVAVGHNGWETTKKREEERNTTNTP